MTDKSLWQAGVGKAWAHSWQLTDRSFAGLTTRFLDLLESLPGRTVLDIGCGAGELSLALARRWPEARIIGVDVSPDLVETARGRAGDNPHAQFELGDATSWTKPGFAPDLLVSRHGVMFFDDPVGAFAHLFNLAAPSARLAFTCFRWPQENPWITGLAEMIPGGAPKFDPQAPGPFAFADPERVTNILNTAGWSGIRIEPVDFAYVTGAGDDPIAEARAFFSQIGPLAPVLRELDGGVRDAVERRLQAWLMKNCHEGLVVFPAAAWQVTARKG
ncbi:MAG: class I SAM-dependent methyltransferase [Novosphingobium sp.]